MEDLFLLSEILIYSIICLYKYGLMDSLIKIQMVTYRNINIYVYKGKVVLFIVQC